jgi:hypothetical protein
VLASDNEAQAISVSVSSGVAIGARSTSTTPSDPVAVLNLAADGGTNNAALNVVSKNTAFSAAEVSGHETGHGTLKISHVNPGPIQTSDANAAAISVDLQSGSVDGTSAQGIFLKSTTGGTSVKDHQLCRFQRRDDLRVDARWITSPASARCATTEIRGPMHLVRVDHGRPLLIRSSAFANRSASARRSGCLPTTSPLSSRNPSRRSGRPSTL